MPLEIEEEEKAPQIGGKIKDAGDPKKAADERRAAQVGVEGVFGEVSNETGSAILEGLTKDEYKIGYPFFAQEEEAFADERERAALSFEMKYDNETDKLLRAAGSEADKIKAERAVNRERVLNDAVSNFDHIARQTRESEIRKRIIDMDRIKPEKAEEALKALDRLMQDINRALSYRGPGDKVWDEWADFALRILAEIEIQIKYDGSYAQRLKPEFNMATDGRRDPRVTSYQEARNSSRLEPEWRKKMLALSQLLYGEPFTETPQQEFRRRLKKEEKIREELYK